MRVSVIASAAMTVTALPIYPAELPNGGAVPSCGVIGHTNCAGGGERTQFGAAFAAAGYTWTEDLCRADSDNDGLTNGEELGDPNCKWTKGAEPEGPALSHPGDANDPPTEAEDDTEEEYGEYAEEGEEEYAEEGEEEYAEEGEEEYDGEGEEEYDEEGEEEYPEEDQEEYEDYEEEDEEEYPEEYAEEGEEYPEKTAETGGNVESATKSVSSVSKPKYSSVSKSTTDSSTAYGVTVTLATLGVAVLTIA